MPRFIYALLAGVLVFSACDSTDPSAPLAIASAKKTDSAAPAASEPVSWTPAIEVSFEAEVPSRHVVLFKGSGVPASFESEVRRLGGTVVFAHPAGVGAVDGLSDAAASRLTRLSGVAEVQPDTDLSEALPEGPQDLQDASVDSPLNPAAAFFFARQWHMRAIDADDAWAAGRLGSSDVTVAILDTGLDYLHADLVGRVDIDRSASFLPSDVEDSFSALLGRLPITDLGYHGTHVGATVASNGFVGAGVTSQTTLMAVKVCYGNTYTFPDGSQLFGCPGSAIFQGLLHAIDNGADVVNMSLGGNFSKAGNGEFIGFVNKLFNYARSQGVTVVVSAGNDAIDLDHDGNAYKTYCSTPSTICVAATGPTDRAGVNGPFTDPDAPASFSNYGRSAINVAAPGGNLNPAPAANNFVYAACSSSSLAIPLCRTSNGFIVGLVGTSMAAPHVSGLASLLVEDYGRSPARIKTTMQQTADDLGARGTDPHYGKGRINVARALGISPDA